MNIIMPVRESLTADQILKIRARLLENLHAQPPHHRWSLLLARRAMDEFEDFIRGDFPLPSRRKLWKCG